MQEATQRERIEKELMSIAPDVTERDRKEFRLMYGFSASTVSGYLRGKGVAIDTGLQMLTFFRSRISEREKVLNG